MKKYNQLDLQRRHSNERLVKLRTSRIDIALELDVHLSTINREVNRDESDQSNKASLYD
jgi:IS30 family transposase